MAVQIASVPVDGQLELVIELDHMGICAPSEEERGVSSFEIQGKGPVGKPPPDTVVGKAFLATPVRNCDGVEESLKFEVTFSLRERNPPAE